jgi:hypothetical protein
MEKNYDQRFKVVFDILKRFMEPPGRHAEGTAGVCIATDELN